MSVALFRRERERGYVRTHLESKYGWDRRAGEGLRAAKIKAVCACTCGNVPVPAAYAGLKQHHSVRSVSSVLYTTAYYRVRSLSGVVPHPVKPGIALFSACSLSNICMKVSAERCTGEVSRCQQELRLLVTRNGSYGKVSTRPARTYDYMRPVEHT